jgi:hypothetical protein
MLPPTSGLTEAAATLRPSTHQMISRYVRHYDLSREDQLSAVAWKQKYKDSMTGIESEAWSCQPHDSSLESMHTKA